uniref:Uncharacterized protein n=1 Tax=Nelumbo nucifera TaxID=4432 RepID=A0A822XSQ7_NELNU|nr:TPA_asm: hypothetical protein HUJ06_024195 [Nelumbo nucifera]
MSAQDTTPGHFSSTRAFAFLMLPNASTGRFLLSCASFSAMLPGLDAIRIDASQPSTKQSWKKRRIVEGPEMGDSRYC